MKCLFEDIVIYKESYHKHYKDWKGKWAKAGVITFESLDLGPLPFVLEENDEVEVYLTIKVEECHKRKIHFHTYLRERSSISLDTIYPEKNIDYSLYINSDENGIEFPIKCVGTEQVVICVANAYILNNDLILIFRIDGTETVNSIICDFENIIIRKESFQKTIRSPYSQKVEENAISFAVFNLGVMPFIVEEGDEIEVYIDISGRYNTFELKKICYNVFLKRKESVEIRTYYPVDKPGYLLVDKGQKISVIYDNNKIAYLSLMRASLDGEYLKAFFCVEKEYEPSNTNIVLNNVCIRRNQLQNKLDYPVYVSLDQGEKIIVEKRWNRFDISEGDSIKVFSELSSNNHDIDAQKVAFFATVSNERIIPYELFNDYQDENTCILSARGLFIYFVATYIKNGKIFGSLLVENNSNSLKKFKVNKVECGKVVIGCLSDTAHLYAGEKCYISFSFDYGFLDIINKDVLIICDNESTNEIEEYKSDYFKISKIFDENYMPSGELLPIGIVEPLRSGQLFKGIDKEEFEISRLSKKDSQYKLSFDYIGPRANGILYVVFIVNGLSLQHKRLKISGKRGEKHSYVMHIDKDCFIRNGIRNENIYKVNIKTRFEDSKYQVINTLEVNAFMSLSKWETGDYDYLPDEVYKDNCIDLSFALPSIAISKVYAYEDSLCFVFRIDVREKSKENTEFVIKTVLINDRKVDFGYCHMNAYAVGTIYEEERLSKDMFEGITVSTGSELKIKYVYEINCDNKVIKTGIDSCFLIVEEPAEELKEYSNTYFTDNQIIYKDDEIEVIFLAAFLNNNSIRWLVQMNNNSSREQKFRIRYALINGILLDAYCALQILPGERLLDLVSYRNPMGFHTLNQNIMLIADNDEWDVFKKIEYKCNSFVIRKVFDKEYHSELLKEEVDIHLEDLLPGDYLEKSDIGAMVFISLEDKTDFLLPRYDLAFKFKPIKKGHVIIKLYINGYCIDEKSVDIEKREIITIVSNLYQKTLRWHGICFNDFYSYKINVVFTPKGRDTVYMEKEYRICLKQLLNSAKKADIDISQIGNYGGYSYDLKLEQTKRIRDKGLHGIYDEETFSLICSMSGWKVKPTGSFFRKVDCFEDFKIAVLEVLPKLNALFKMNGLFFDEYLFSDDEESGVCTEYTYRGKKYDSLPLKWKKRDPYLSEYILKYTEMCFREYVCYDFLTWPEELTSFMKLKCPNGSTIYYLCEDETILERQKKYISIYPQITRSIRESINDYLVRNGPKWMNDKKRFVAEKDTLKTKIETKKQAEEIKKAQKDAQKMTEENVYEYIKNSKDKISLKIIMSLYDQISTFDKLRSAKSLSNVIRDAWIIDSEGYSFPELKSRVIGNAWFWEDVSAAVDGDIRQGLPYFYSYHNVSKGTLSNKVKSVVVETGVVLVLTLIRSYLNATGIGFERFAYGEYYSGEWLLYDGMCSTPLHSNVSKKFGKYIYTVENGEASCSEYRPDQNVRNVLRYILRETDNALRLKNGIKSLLPVNEKKDVEDLLGENTVDVIRKIIDVSAKYAYNVNVYNNIDRIKEIDDSLFEGMIFDSILDVEIWVKEIIISLFSD